jgi:hypothetical protein
LVAVQTLLFDNQLPIDAVETVEFGTVRTDMSLTDQTLANKTGKDLY